jgi:S1-C subfamily serine protease
MKFAPKKATTGADAVVIGFPQDGPFDARPARIRDSRDIPGPNIYDSGKVTRDIYTIRALVRSGNSGGPLMSTDGTILGVVFAAAADDEQTGFALTADEAAPVADAGLNHNESTSTGKCA